MNAAVYAFLSLLMIFAWWAVLFPGSFKERFPSCARWMGIATEPNRSHRFALRCLHFSVALGITVFACFVWLVGVRF